jgi:hypothetical protein
MWALGASLRMTSQMREERARYNHAKVWRRNSRTFLCWEGVRERERRTVPRDCRAANRMVVGSCAMPVCASGDFFPARILPQRVRPSVAKYVYLIL